MDLVPCIFELRVFGPSVGLVARLKLGVFFLSSSEFEFLLVFVLLDLAFFVFLGPAASKRASLDYLSVDPVYSDSAPYDFGAWASFLLKFFLSCRRSHVFRNPSYFGSGGLYLTGTPGCRFKAPVRFHFSDGFFLSLGRFSGAAMILLSQRRFFCRGDDC